MSALTFLFIPVSSLEGIGEYTRSLIIAKNIAKKWPSVKIHFVLNQGVAYLDSCPFEVFTTEQSATKDSAAVNLILEKIKPDFVLFDASGRAENFRKAKELGAKVGFISQHEKKRSRGLKFNRIANIDKHWVVQPDFAIAPLSIYQQLKLKLLSQKAPKHVGAVFEYKKVNDGLAVLAKYDLPTEFFVFNAGSGGHKKSNQYCVEKFYQAAKILAIQSSIHCVVVLGENYPKTIASDKHVTCIKTLEHNDFIQLLIAAKGRLVSAGGTILQCIALALPSIAVTISSDQPKRLKACLQHKLVLTSQLEEHDMVDMCQQLLKPEVYQNLYEIMATHQADDALTIMTNDISSLLKLPLK